MSPDLQTRPPSINQLLSHEAAAELTARFGRDPVKQALRSEAEIEAARLRQDATASTAPGAIIEAARKRLDQQWALKLRPVLNLTGTVLHTNLGRAPLPEEALDAIRSVSAGAANLEFDLVTGKRGDRDTHLADWLVRLTGAEAATVVNNNAAAVLLALHTLSRRKETIVSRGELVEIGSSFRLPDIIDAAGARMREVGTTNRTRRADYEQAIGPRTGALMRIHPSNYRIEGFSEAASNTELAALARDSGLPFIIDLGAGSLVDLESFGLPHEQTPREAIAAGASLVTFSGDKLLGGPQAGIIVGQADLIARLNKNPLKRALRCDKMTIAALATILPFYAAPERLAQRLPGLRLLTRDVASIQASATRLAPQVASALNGLADVSIVECSSQIGSGALPSDLLPSAGLRLAPLTQRISDSGLAALLRELSTPVIGRMVKGAVLLDLRCLEDDEIFVRQLPELRALGAGLTP
jgi:L-seryl-tRNA(Ser) seleniumtransferase